MRARLAIAVSGQNVELREVVLRDKPQAFLQISPSATVPCLETSDGVIDESLDIMLWALGRHDPLSWLEIPDEGEALIQHNDGPFKVALDRYKYASRHQTTDPLAERDRAAFFLLELDNRLRNAPALFGCSECLADMAILPFVRQFAHVDLGWFNDQPWPHLRTWLERFKDSELFAQIMRKYPAWSEDSDKIKFPPKGILA